MSADVLECCDRFLSVPQVLGGNGWSRQTCWRGEKSIGIFRFEGENFPINSLQLYVLRLVDGSEIWQSTTWVVWKHVLPATCNSCKGLTFWTLIEYGPPTTFLLKLLPFFWWQFPLLIGHQQDFYGFPNIRFVTGNWLQPTLLQTRSSFTPEKKRIPKIICLSLPTINFHGRNCS